MFKVSISQQIVLTSQEFNIGNSCSVVSRSTCFLEEFQLVRAHPEFKIGCIMLDIEVSWSDRGNLFPIPIKIKMAFSDRPSVVCSIVEFQFNIFRLSHLWREEILVMRGFVMTNSVELIEIKPLMRSSLSVVLL